MTDFVQRASAFYVCNQGHRSTDDNGPGPGAENWMQLGDNYRGTFLRYRGEWASDIEYRASAVPTGPVDNRMDLFREGVYALFGDISTNPFKVAGSGTEKSFPHFELTVEGLLDGKPVPILLPAGRAADPEGSDAPYGILDIRHADREYTTLGGTRYTARGTVNVTLYRRPRAGLPPGQAQAEEATQIVKDLDGTAATLANMFNRYRKATLPNGFPAYFDSARSEELGAEGPTYRMRVSVPFTYYGQAQRT